MKRSASTDVFTLPETFFLSSNLSWYLKVEGTFPSLIAFAGFLASASVLYVGYANASTSAYSTDPSLNSSGNIL